MLQLVSQLASSCKAHKHSCICATLACTDNAGENLVLAHTGDDGGYHFVFMPSHLFPAYPSYRWWAVIADR